MKETCALLGMGIVLWIVLFYPAMRIVIKAGHSRWVTVLFCIPVVFLGFMAFAEWPVRKREAASE